MDPAGSLTVRAFCFAPLNELWALDFTVPRGKTVALRACARTFLAIGRTDITTIGRVVVTATELDALRKAALIADPITGLTHGFYRYPARFSPQLARAAIRLFSEPGQLVLDPFSGGGTTVVEAAAMGRRAVGTDISELATFLARLKTARVPAPAARVLRAWARDTVPLLSYRDHVSESNRPPSGTDRNLRRPATRAIRKLIGVALSSIPSDPEPTVETIARGAILGTAQWAIDGRREVGKVATFRSRLQATVHRMLDDLQLLWEKGDAAGAATPHVATADALDVGLVPPLSDGTVADLVVTSPPYPGIHVLYHRWQTGGGKETPAPFWIAAARDGKGESHYTMGGRRSRDYFERLSARISAIRQVMRDGAFLVQVVGFSQAAVQLERYLETMRASGFMEIPQLTGSRIWRDVPRRRWYVAHRATVPAAREVILVHQARCSS